MWVLYVGVCVCMCVCMYVCVCVCVLMCVCVCVFQWDGVLFFCVMKSLHIWGISVKNRCNDVRIYFYDWFFGIHISKIIMHQ